MTKRNYSALKSILATASVAAISLGSTEVMAAQAVGDTFRTSGNAALGASANWRNITVDVTGATAATVNPGLNSTLQLGGAHDISLANAGTTITAVDMRSNAGRTITVDAANAYTVNAINSTGGLVGDTINLTYNQAGQVTIGNTSARLLNVNFAGNAGTLTITTGNVGGTINSTGASAGALVIAGATTVTGAIGGTNALTSITINAGGTLTAGNNITATTTNVAGTLAIGANSFYGGVIFTNVNGAITTAYNGNVNGNITTGTAGFGTFTLAGNVPVAGDVGANGLSIGTFNVGAADYVGTNNKNIYANTVNVQGNTFDVEGNSILSATTINILAGATLKAGGNGITATTTNVGEGSTLNLGANTITGNVDFGGNAGIITLAGGTLTGAVVNSGAADNGTINTTANNSTITGVIGVTKAIHQITVANGSKLIAQAALNSTNVTLAGTGNLTSAGAIQSNVISIGSGTLTAGEGITGIGGGVNNAAVKFAGAGNLALTGSLQGSIDFANNLASVKITGGNVSGTIDSTVGSAGALIIAGATTVTGAIGGTNALTSIAINPGAALTTVAAVKAATTTLGGTLTVGAGGYTGNINFGLNANQALTLNGGVLIGTVQFAKAGDTITTTGAGVIQGNIALPPQAGYGSYKLVGANLGGSVGGVGLPIGTFTAGGTANVSTNGKSVYAQDVVVAGNTFTIAAGDTLVATNITLTGNLTLAGAPNANTAGVINAGAGTLTFLNAAPSVTPGISSTAGFTGNMNIAVGGNISQNLFTTGGQINLGGKTTLVAGGNLSAATIAGNALTIAADSEITATTSIDANVPITINDGVTLTLGDGTIVNSTIDSEDFLQGNLVIGAGGTGVTFNGELGGADGFELITIGKGATLTTAVAGNMGYARNTTLAGTLNIGAGLVYNSIINAGNGTLNFAGDPSVALTSTAAGFTGNINFKGAGTVNKNLETTGVTTLGNNLTVAAGGEIGGGNVNVGAFTLTHNAGTVSGAVYGTGTYTTNNPAGNATLGTVANALANAQIAAGTFTPTGNMYVTNLTVARGATLNTSAAAITETGNVNYNAGAIIQLGTQTQTVNGTITLGGVVGTPVVINATVDPATNTIGNMTATSILANGKSVTINIPNIIVRTGTKLTLLTNVDGMPTITNLVDGTIHDSGGGQVGGFTEFTPSIVSGKLILTAKSDLEAIKLASDKLRKAIGENPSTSDFANNRNIASYFDTLDDAESLTGDASALANEVLGVLNDPNATKEQINAATETVARVVTVNTNQAQDVNKSVVSTVVSTVSTRISVPHTPTGFKMGKSSGSEDNGYIGGLWVKGVAGNATQKVNKGVAGYKSTTLALVLGADGNVNDQLRVGIAGAYADGKIKMTSYKSGDRVNSKSWLLSLYGSYDFTDNIYGNAIATLASSTVYTKEKKLSNGVRSQSKGSYNSQSYGLDVAAGYRVSLADNIILTPEAGFTLLGFNNGSYTETGGAYNRTVTNKGGMELRGNVGATISTSFDYAHGVIAPSVYAKLSQYLAGKNPSSSAKLDGQTEAFSNKQKPNNKTMFHVGVDAMASFEMMEYGASYDFAAGNSKYMAHTGSLKVKVNF